MAIAKHEYVKTSAIVNDWLTDFGITGKIDEDLYKRWVSDRAHELIGTEQLTYGLALFDIVNYKHELLEGLHSIYAVVCTDKPEHYTNKYELKGYTEKIYGTECDLEVNILCPKCKDKDCKCDTGTMDIHVDELYLRQHPWLWEMTSSHYLGYNAPITDGPARTTRQNPLEAFTVMQPRSANDVLWNSDYYLGVCKGLGAPCKYSYDIEPPYFITDMKEGQVFIAYLKYNIDEEGYYMVPNYPIVVRALEAYITEKYMWRQWMKDDGNQNNRLRHLDAKNEAERLLAEARSELEMPSPDKWKQIMEKTWIQDRSRFYYR